jgi:hypothetical protein
MKIEKKLMKYELRIMHSVSQQENSAFKLEISLSAGKRK